MSLIRLPTLEERLDRRAESLLSLARAARLEPSPARRARYLETALRFGDLEPDAGWYRSGAEEGERWDEVAPETALLIAECWLGAEGCKRATPWLDRAASGSNVTGSNATGSNATGSKAAKALLYRGECAAAAKDSAAAVEFLEAARNRSTEDSATSRRILLALGDAYHAEHRYEAAAAVFAVAGETDRADAMTQAQQASLHNAEVDLRVAECRQRRDQYDALLAEHRDLEGTAEWLDLLRTSEERMSDCRAYL